jgi:hypothetical protein
MNVTVYPDWISNINDIQCYIPLTNRRKRRHWITPRVVVLLSQQQLQFGPSSRWLFPKLVWLSWWQARLVRSNPLASPTYKKNKTESSNESLSIFAVLTTTETKDLQFEVSKLDRIWVRCELFGVAIQKERTIKPAGFLDLQKEEDGVVVRF